MEERGTPKTKGQVLRTFVTCVRQLRGEAVVDAVLARVSPELAEGLTRGSIVPGGWYPVAWYSELHRALGELTGEGLALARMIGREATKQDFKGVYRFFVIVLSPESIVVRANKVFSMFWDTGTARVVEAKKGYAKGEFTGCEGYDAYLWEDMIGAIEALIEMGGGRDIRSKVLSGGGDSTGMVIEHAWT